MPKPDHAGTPSATRHPQLDERVRRGLPCRQAIPVEVSGRSLSTLLPVSFAELSKRE